MAQVHTRIWNKMTEVREDERWIRNFLAGDVAAFDALYHKYYNAVYRICYGVLLHSEDAQDATQEVFTIVHKNLNSYGFESSFYTWLYRVAFNRAIHVKRAFRHRRREESMPEGFDKASSDNLETNLGNEEVFAELLQTLTDEDRSILTLHYWEQQSIREISIALNCSETAAKTRLFRAREKLKKVMNSNQNLSGELI